MKYQIIAVVFLSLATFNISAQEMECTSEDVQIRWQNSDIWEEPIIENVTLEEGIVGEHAIYATPGFHRWEAKTPELIVRKIIAIIDLRAVPIGTFTYDFRCRIRIGDLIGPWSELNRVILISVPGKPARIVAQ